MDTIFYGGTILSMDRERTRYPAMLVSDGRIAAFGTLAQLLVRCPRAKLFDLRSRALLPAFIDSHGHFTFTASTLDYADLRSCRDADEIAKRMVERFSDQDGWAIGFGYDDTKLALGHPDKTLLDERFSLRPALIIHISAHMAVLNSAALELCGINADTPEPSDGRIERDEQGVPTGFVEEAAYTKLVAPRLPLDAQRLFSLMGKCERLYFENGFTTAQEGMVNKAAHSLLSSFSQGGGLRLDLIGYLDENSCDITEATFSEYTNGYRNHYRIGGYKIFLDGSLQAKTGWLTQPYEGEKEYRGYPAMSNERVGELVQRANAQNVPLLAHCNGDAACLQFLRAHKTQSKRRNVMIHAQLMPPDAMETAKQLNVMPSFFVSHVREWGDAHIKNLGIERAQNISPAASALQAGLPFTFHRDSPVLLPNALEMLADACERVTESGAVLGASQRIGIFDALLALTAYGAYQYGEENDKGTLAPGKRADLTVLERDPLECLPHELRSLSVCATFKDGVRVFGN